MAKKAKKTAATSNPQPEPVESGSGAAPETEIPSQALATGIEDPIGDVSDGEARTSLADEVRLEVDAQAESVSKGATAKAEETAGDSAEPPETESDPEPDFTPSPRPPAKLERLQKILSRAGVASRRKAEEMIEQGRVQVNGTVVTELGTKADAARDHIRVDGKLLHGAERLRYFVLNKPKGYVTTVRDPEGRPTVMQFFDKMRERLYPVGRLDYMSEGLLLVTNDGDLANRLTKAGSGVEKVYLVKVAGQPTEAELDILRGGVAIERGKPGSPQVRTSPARIRQVRQGDNPWYEVVLIEGRNRELRKMFSAIGHFVEKIRRVGYGPLVLDQEPGDLRELEPAELAALRLAAEGKLRTPKAKEVRRRNLADAQLPTLPPKPSRPQPAKPFEPRKLERRPATAGRPGEFRPKRPFGTDRPFRPARHSGEGFRPAAGRGEAGAGKSNSPKFGPPRPAWKKADRAARPPVRYTAGPSREDRPFGAKPYGDRPANSRTYGSKPAAGRTYDRTPAGRPFDGKPASGKPAWKKPTWKKPGSNERPRFARPAAPRREPPARAEGLAQNRPPKLRIDAVEPDRPDTHRSETRRPDMQPAGPARSSASRPKFDRPKPGKPGFSKPGFERPRPDRPSFSKPKFEKLGVDRPGGRGRSGEEASGHSRPPRGENGLARPFTTSSGKPRAGGARPSSKPFKPGGFSKSGPKGAGFRGKSGGVKRTGPRPGGKKRG
jgi:23S rRNA pseudouridine2605 synthase